jgi:hypothetical protein
MDAIIQIVFVLLILSLITERITNLVKVRPSSWFKSVCMIFKMGSKEDTVDPAEVKMREVQIIAIVVGVLIALAARASIFQIHDASFKLGWADLGPDYKFVWDGIYDIFGCLLAGIFLSLGSKFFHDLLDLLLQAKNLKRKLNDREGIQDLHTIEEFDKYIAEVEPVMVEAELNKYLASMSNFKHFEYSEDDQAADVYMNPLSEAELQALKKSITVKLANKKSIEIELNYIDF